MKADLHIHSWYSFDSYLTPDQLIKIAKEKGLSFMAICDHNEIIGSKMLQESSEIESISGIEIDCTFNEDVIHLLGYGIDLDHPYYTSLCTHYKKELARIGLKRKQLIEERFKIQIDMKQVEELSHGGYSYTNVELCMVMFKQYPNHPDFYPYIYGDRSKNPIANFYWDHFAIGKWGYVEMALPDYKEVIQQIHQTGGLCIVAHPIIGVKNKLENVLKLLEAGVDGFEAYCSYHQKEDTLFYLEVCGKYQVLYTCGSDFHGPSKPNIEIGQTYHEDDDQEWLDCLLKKLYTKKSSA